MKKGADPGINMDFPVMKRQCSPLLKYAYHQVMFKYTELNVTVLSWEQNENESAIYQSANQGKA